MQRSQSFRTNHSRVSLQKCGFISTVLSWRYQSPFLLWSTLLLPLVIRSKRAHPALSHSMIWLCGVGDKGLPTYFLGCGSNNWGSGAADVTGLGFVLYLIPLFSSIAYQQQSLFCHKCSIFTPPHSCPQVQAEQNTAYNLSIVFEDIVVQQWVGWFFIGHLYIMPRFSHEMKPYRPKSWFLFSDWPGLCLFCCHQPSCFVSQQSWFGFFCFTNYPIMLFPPDQRHCSAMPNPQAQQWGSWYRVCLLSWLFWRRTRRLCTLSGRWGWWWWWRWW